MSNELVHLPANVKLYQFQEGTLTCKAFTHTQKPINVLLVENNNLREVYSKILYEGSIWHVHKNHYRRVETC